MKYVKQLPSHIRVTAVTLPTAPLPTQFLANATRKAEEHGPMGLVLATHVEDQDIVPGFWLYLVCYSHLGSD